MTSLQEYLTNESFRSMFAKGAEFRRNDPNHRKLYDSFVDWFMKVRKKYDEDVILNMLIGTIEEIELGEL